MIRKMPNASARVIQLCTFCKCVFDFFVGVRAYQSLGVEIQSNEYRPLTSLPVYSVPPEDISSLCVILWHSYPLDVSIGSAQRVSSTISATFLRVAGVLVSVHFLASVLVSVHCNVSVPVTPTSVEQDDVGHASSCVSYSRL